MKNSKEIENHLKSKYPKNPNYATILKILQNIPCTIAEYNNYKYKEIQIRGPPNENKTVAIDESLRYHEQNQQVW